MNMYEYERLCMGGDNDCDSVYDLPQPGIRENSGEIEMPEFEVCVINEEREMFSYENSRYVSGAKGGIHDD